MLMVVCRVRSRLAKRLLVAESRHLQAGRRTLGCRLYFLLVPVDVVVARELTLGTESGPEDVMCGEQSSLGTVAVCSMSASTIAPR